MLNTIIIWFTTIWTTDVSFITQHYLLIIWTVMLVGLILTIAGSWLYQKAGSNQ